MLGVLVQTLQAIFSPGDLGICEYRVLAHAANRPTELEHKLCGMFLYDNQRIARE